MPPIISLCEGKLGEYNIEKEELKDLINKFEGEKVIDIKIETYNLPYVTYFTGEIILESFVVDISGRIENISSLKYIRILESSVNYFSNRIYSLEKSKEKFMNRFFN